jgi:hypothetical protein
MYVDETNVCSFERNDNEDGTRILLRRRIKINVEIDPLAGYQRVYLDQHQVETALNLWKLSARREGLEEMMGTFICDPARTLRKSVLDSMRLSRCYNLSGNKFHKCHFIIIPAESLLLQSHVDLKDKPLVVAASPL